MKKGLIILCLLLIPATLFASAFGFRAGAAVKYDGDLGNLTTASTEDIKFPNDFGFGADVNIKVLFADVDMTAYFGSNETNNAVIDGLISANAGVDLANFRITLGGGFAYVFNYDTGEIHLKGYASQDNFGEELKDSPIHLRAAVGLDFSNLNLSVFGIYNTNQTINNFQLKEIFDEFDWKNIQVGVALAVELIK